MSLLMTQWLVPMPCDVHKFSPYALLLPRVSGEYLELDIPLDLGDDHTLTLQPDTPISKHMKPANIWPEPQILEAVGSKIRYFTLPTGQKPLVASSTSTRSYPP